MGPLAIHLEEEKLGSRDASLRQFGWSIDHVHRTANGGRFPSCCSCRKKNVKAPLQNATLAENQCEVCGNWTLSERTRQRLSFKTHCVAHLHSCGVNGKQQDRICEAAKKAHNDQVEINWNDEESVEGCMFPAGWSGDLAVQGFIEMLMHLLFSGVEESNFTLCNECLLDVGRPVETFKKAVHVLLKDLTTFHLSWLLVLPFSGSTKTKLTTGT